MPYARFISKWFANVPNINLGIMQSFLTGEGKECKNIPFPPRFPPLAEEFSSTDNRKIW